MKKIPKETKKYIINELIKFLKNKEDREKRAIIHAYFEKKKYEKTKKLN
jgi:hypothetical protein